VLPYAPRVVWLVPGELWRLAAPVLVGLCIALPPVLRRLEMRRSLSLGPVRPFAIALLAVTLVTDVLWGGALLRGIHSW
jgi:hypothetical protein